MSAKKKKKPGTAQQFIDSLLDERTPSPVNTGETSGAVRLVEESATSEAVLPPGDGETVSIVNDEPVMISVANHEMQSALELEGDETYDFAQRNQMVEQPMPEALQIDGDPAEVDQATTTGISIEGEESQSFPSTPSLGSSEDLTEELGQEERTVRLDTKAKPKKSRPFSIVTSSQVTALETQVPPATGFKPGAYEEEAPVDPGGLTDLKTTLRGRGEKNQGRAGSTIAANAYPSTEAALRQSESLRIAQSRISELEAELERLRRDNERLATAGETLSRRSDELVAKVENLDSQNKEAGRIHEEEKKVFRGQIQQKEREVSDLRQRLEEMEARLETNFKKIRVRERELEHRLEIVRMESQTLVSTKDKMILDLKRQIDQLTHENEYGKQKSQELYNQYKDKQETARRVVRALRIALTILEGDEDVRGKKTE